MIEIHRTTGFISQAQSLSYDESVNLNFDGTLNSINPLSFVMKKGTNDTFTLRQAMKEDDWEDFIIAMQLEIKCTLFEDNNGALELAKHPKTKHTALKYHQFQSWIKSDNTIIDIIYDKVVFMKAFKKMLEKYEVPERRELSKLFNKAKESNELHRKVYFEDADGRVIINRKKSNEYHIIRKIYDSSHVPTLSLES